MQMPVFSGMFMFQDVRIRERKSGCGIYLGPLYPTWILTNTKNLSISASDPTTARADSGNSNRGMFWS